MVDMVVNSSYNFVFYIFIYSTFIFYSLKYIFFRLVVGKRERGEGGGGLRLWD